MSPANAFSLGARLRKRLLQESELSDEPQLNTGNIQGNVVPGFNTRMQVLLGLRFPRVKDLRYFLVTVLPELTTANDVFGYRQYRKQNNLSPASDDVFFLNIGMGSETWAHLQPAGEKDSPCPSFTAGFARHANRLAIKKQQLSACDCLLIAGANNTQTLYGRLTGILDKLDSIRTIRFSGLGEVLMKEGNYYEPFGFRDGISQPALRGWAGGNRLLSPRENEHSTTDLKGQALVWPGEFIFGYPAQNAEQPSNPGTMSGAGNADWKDGSLLALLQIAQNPEKFNKFLEEESRRLKLKLPAVFGSLTGNELGALLMGRDKTGKMLPACASDKTMPEKPENQVTCPVGSHTAKSFARQLPEAQRHRLLRRGIPYRKGNEQGLYFMSYLTDLGRQFEHVLFNWLMDKDFPAPGTGTDPLTAGLFSPGKEKFFTIPYTDAAGNRLEEKIVIPNDLTSLIDGGYFFLPSLQTLKKIAHA